MRPSSLAIVAAALALLAVAPARVRADGDDWRGELRLRPTAAPAGGGAAGCRRLRRHEGGRGRRVFAAPALSSSANAGPGHDICVAGLQSVPGTLHARRAPRAARRARQLPAALARPLLPRRTQLVAGKGKGHGRGHRGNGYGYGNGGVFVPTGGGGTVNQAQSGSQSGVVVGGGNLNQARGASREAKAEARALAFGERGRRV
jgi:hypothetical protein